jgi:hypothetical protein
MPPHKAYTGMAVQQRHDSGPATAEEVLALKRRDAEERLLELRKKLREGTYADRKGSLWEAIANKITPFKDAHPGDIASVVPAWLALREAMGRLDRNDGIYFHPPGSLRDLSSVLMVLEKPENASKQDQIGSFMEKCRNLAEVITKVRS